MNIPVRPVEPKPAPAKPDPAYLDAVRQLPCCIGEAFGGGCEGPVAAHHTICGRYGQHRTPDRQAIPLCWAHHQGPLGIHSDKHSWQQEYGPDTDYISATQDKILQGKLRRGGAA